MPRQVKLNYSLLRARMLEKGTNLRRWAEANNLPVTTVYGAARGERGGIKSVRIQNLLQQAFLE